ncbi:hypothetical protein GCM10025776_10320 [Corallincola platygyrae]
MALQVTEQLLQSSEQPVDFGVFASRHGEIHRTFQLLKNIVDRESLSPTAFSQSVHNTASGLFGITRKQTIPTTSIAARAGLTEQAWIEAYSYLKLNPKHSVLLVVFDETIPEQYQTFVEQQKDIAFALQLGAESSSAEGVMVSLSTKDLSRYVELDSGGRSSPWQFMQALVCADQASSGKFSHWSVT